MVCWCAFDVGGSYPETGLSDISLSWMMNKGKALGLEFTDAAWQRYGVIDAKHALDKIHESWNIVWLFPRHRQIDKTAVLASSVSIRYFHDDTYRPQNLPLTSALSSGESVGYQVEPVVTPPPQ